jgi:multiple sugar transport system permease protein
MLLTRRQQVLLLTPFIIVVAPFLICPTAFGFAASFTDYMPFRTSVAFTGFQNYARVLQDNTFMAAVGNGGVFTLVTVAMEMVIGFAVAYALRRPFKGRALLRFILLIPWLVSPAASGVMWHQLLSNEHGLLSYWTALLGLPPPAYPLVSAPFASVIAVEVWRKAPLVSFLILPGLQAIPGEQWDNAKLDGLSLPGQIRHLVLPRLRLLLLTVTLLLTGDALGVSESVFFLTGGGPGVQTMTPGLYSYNQAIRGFNWSAAAIPGWITALTVLLLGLSYLYLTSRWDENL